MDMREMLPLTSLSLALVVAPRRRDARLCAGEALSEATRNAVGDVNGAAAV
jgi:hypothetical protein